jgi:hypothetical protein
MNLSIRNIALVLFLLTFAVTIIVYFRFEQNMQLTWIFGGASAVCYLIFRFSKR